MPLFNRTTLSALIASLCLGVVPASTRAQDQVANAASKPGVPDLRITQTGPQRVPQGWTMTYTLRYTNSADAAEAKGVEVVATLPPNVLLNSESLPANASFVGNFVFWTLSTVEPSESGQLRFQAVVPLTVPSGSVLTNSVHIASSQRLDLNPTNNTSTWLSTVVPGCTPVSIHRQPMNVIACAGGTAIFSAEIKGTAPFQHHWRRDGVPIPGATNTSLALEGVTPAHAGSYDLVANNSCGAVTSSAATLTVTDPIVIASAPTNQAVCPGETAAFSVSATGPGVRYQWYRGAKPLEAETGRSLTLINAAPADAGSYSVVVSGECATRITNVAALTVNETISILEPLANHAVCPGDMAVLAVRAKGVGLSYEWFHGAKRLPPTGNALAINAASRADAGTYTVVVSDACGSRVTNTAALSINDPLSLVAGPTDASVTAGGAAQLQVTATGTGVSYQWFKGTDGLAGETNSTLSLTAVSPADAGTYYVFVGAVCSSPVIRSAMLTVKQAAPAADEVPALLPTGLPSAAAAK